MQIYTGNHLPAKLSMLISVGVGLCPLSYAGNLADGGQFNSSVDKVLSTAGVIRPVPAIPSLSLMPQESRSIKMVASIAGSSGEDANGLIIKFGSAEAKRLSRENQPPPKELTQEVERLAGVKLNFGRAMSMDSFVFSFASSLSWDDAQKVVNRVRESSFVEKVEIDAQSHHLMTPNDPYYSDYQWNLQSPVNFPGAADVARAWGITQGSANTVVAVVDTGIRPHVDFASRLLAGYDFVSNPTSANDGDGRDSDAKDPGDWTLAEECGVGKAAHNSSWHGTHVTGIIAATGNNSTGVAGINWNTKILPVRVLGKCGGTLSDIVDGMSWAAGLAVPGVPANPNPAKVINMSLGGVSPNGCGKTLYQDAINKIKAKGILIVVAAGNSNDEAANFVPASCDGVMTVGATGPTGDRASYSNYSSQFKVDISAPGGDSGVYGSAYGILSTVNSGKNGPESSTYDYKNGTSMAAPHIAGIATLGLALDPEIAPELLQLSLLLTSQSFPATSQCTTMYPVCGVGIVSAYDSLQAVVALKPYSLIYEYKNINTGHYFRTNNAGESAFVLNGGAGDGWVDTKDYFLAWRDSSQGASPVCRFYSAGSNSHFFTADAGECALVKKNPDWNYEGIAYYVRQTNQGTCPVDTLPIYRAYNNRWMYKDGNHRFSTDLSAINELVAKNWIFEGIAMCAAGG